MAVQDILLQALSGEDSGGTIVDQYAQETARRAAEDARFKKLRSFGELAKGGYDPYGLRRVKKLADIARQEGLERKKRKEFDDGNARRTQGRASTLLSGGSPDTGSTARRTLFGV